MGDNGFPQSDSVRYLGMHLNKSLTWKKHIKAKRDELNMRFRNIFGWWHVTPLSTNRKLLISKMILKPIWMYSVHLWERLQCKYNAKAAKLAGSEYKTQLENYPKDLATALATISYTKRLLRHDIQKLGDRWWGTRNLLLRSFFTWWTRQATHLLIV